MASAKRIFETVLVCLLLGSATPSFVWGGDGLFNGLKTLGGPIAWTDQVIHGDWRIQKHATLGHYRLLDARDRRIAFGSIEHCFTQLQRRRHRGEIAPMPPHVVIVMHGLAGSRRFMRGLTKHLSQQGGFTVLNFGYASTMGTIEEQTVALESVVRNLEGVHEVSFVAHSMGNIMIRHLLWRFERQQNPPAIAFRRLVMISPPNHGAHLADTIGEGPIVQFALGEVVDQFAPEKGWPKLEAQLVTPPFEFGIVAGGKGNDRGYLPRLPGDDDGLLSLQTHMLDGAAGFIQTGGRHQFMPSYQSVHDATLRFLLYGHF